LIPELRIKSLLPPTGHPLRRDHCQQQGGEVDASPGNPTDMMVATHEALNGVEKAGPLFRDRLKDARTLMNAGRGPS
jgi:hypothetical protein